jgi:hypothetical protein
VKKQLNPGSKKTSTKKPTRTIEVVRMPAGRLAMDYDSKGRAKSAGPKPMPKPKTSAPKKIQTLPYDGGKPTAKKLPGSGKAPAARKLGRY